ncbi:DNA cytosine methyltransferase [Sulfurimonas sp.]
MQLVLSLFTGVGLLDKAFREAGFCVVSAGDIIYGQDIRDFTGMKNKFNGVIGGSPCQDFSTLKREKGDYSLLMLNEFMRIVLECEPDWYLLENVKSVPNVTDLDKIGVTLQRKKYTHQRFDINQAWYDNYTRLRHIQFGSKHGLYLNIPRGISQNILGGCALASDNRSFRELCMIQGLNDNFNLPDFTVKGKKKLIGNGVPLSIGRVLAQEVKSVTDLLQKSVTDRGRHCACGCGRVVNGRKKTYDSTCRKRLSRKNKKCD